MARLTAPNGNAGLLDVQVFTDGAWADGTNAPTNGNFAAPHAFSVPYRNFDLAYENDTGDGLVLYEDVNSSNSTLKYRTWDGASWSNETTLDFTAVNESAAEVSWIECEADFGSDNILCAWRVKTALGLYAAVWNGSSWQHISAINVADGINTRQDFDVAWEGTSGEGMVVYGVGGAWDASTYSTGSGFADTSSIGALTNAPQWISIAGSPSHDYIAAWVGNVSSTTAGDVDVDMWNGSNWTTVTTPTTMDDDINSNGFAKGGDVAWEQGGGDRALFVWRDGTVSETALRYMFYDISANEWQAIEDGTQCANTEGAAGSRELITSLAAAEDSAGPCTATLALADVFSGVDLNPDPASNKIMVLAEDLTADLAPELFQYNGDTNATWTQTATMAAPEADLSTGVTLSASLPSKAYDFAYRASNATNTAVLGTQTASMSIPSTTQYVGGAFGISSSSSVNVTSITITEQGTVNAQTNLDNIKLRYEADTTSPYNCASVSYDGSETQFGSTDTDGFSAANGTSAFTGSVAITSTSTMCVYVEVDVGSGAADAETIEIEISTPATHVVVSAGGIGPTALREISGTTTLTAPAGNLTIAGNIYEDEASTALAACPSTIAVSVNGAAKVTGSCAAGVISAIDTGAAAPAAGTPIVIWVDDATDCGGNNTNSCATTVIRYSGSGNITDLVMRRNRLIIRDDDATGVSNANIGTQDDTNDTDIVYEVDGSNNIVVEDGIKVIVPTGDTYTPAGTVTTSPSGSSSTVDGDVDVIGTLTLAANALSVGGDFSNTGTVSYSAGQTTTFTATATGHTIEDGSNNFHHATFNGSGGGWSISSDLTLAGDLTITAGNFTVGAFSFTTTGATSITGTLTISSATGTKTFTGNVTVNSSGTWNNSGNEDIGLAGNLTNNQTFTAGSGVYTMSGTSKTISGTIAIPNLTISGTTQNDGTLTVSTALAGTSTLTNGATGTLNIGQASVPLSSGTLTATASGNTVNYTAAAPNCKVTTYHHLTFSGSGAITCATLATVGGNLDLSTGSTMTWTTGANLAVTGTFTIGTGVTFTGGASFTLTVTGATTVNGAITFPNTAALKTFTGGLTIASGATYANAGNSTLTFGGGGLTNNTSGTLSMGTGLATFNATGALAGSNGITFGGALTVSAGTLTNNNTSTVTVTTTLTLTGNWTQGTNSTLTLPQANPFSGAGTFDASTNVNTVNYGGASPTCKVVTYSTLNLTGSGSTACAVTTVTNDVSLSGTITWNNSANLAITDTLTVGNGTSLGNSNTISVANVTVTGTGVISNGASFTASASLAGTGSFTNQENGTLNIGFSSEPTITTLTATEFVEFGNTVNYTAASPNCKVTTYYNLTFSGSGTVTCAVTTVNNDISLSGTVSWTTGANLAATNNVSIGNGTTLIMGSTYTLSFASLTVGSGSSGVFTGNAAAINGGDVTINSGATFTSTSGTLSLAGSFTNSGTFNHASGTVALTTTSTATITGATTFYNFSVTGIGAAKTVRFQAGTTFSFAGPVNSFVITGTAGNLITITSTTTAVWLADFTNTQAAVTYASIAHSGCSTSAVVTLDGTSVDDPTATANDSACWSFVVTGITISGTVYQTDRSTTLASKTVNLRINGTLTGTGAGGTGIEDSDGSGNFSFTSVTVSAGDTVTLYLDGETQDANTITITDGSTNITSLPLYDDHVVIRSDNSTTAITILDLLDYDSDQNNTEMLFDAEDSSPDTLIVEDGNALIIHTGDTFTPGGSVTTDPSASAAAVDGDLEIDGTGTLSMGTNALSVGGDYTNDGTFSKSTGQTTTFTATATGHSITDGGENFDSVVFNGASGGWSFADSTTIDVDLTMTAGTLSGTNDITVTTDVVGTAGVITLTGGTFEQRVGASESFGTSSGSANWTFNNLTFSRSAGTPTITTQSGGSGTITVTGQLLISKTGDGAATTLDASSRTWILSSSNHANPLDRDQASGVLDADSATFNFTGDNDSGDVTVEDTTYAVINLGGAVAENYTFEGTVFTTTLTVDTNATLIGSTLVATANATGNGTITHTGTFVVDGTGNFGGNTNWSFALLYIGDGSGVTTTTATGSGSITVSDTLTLDIEQTLNAGSKTWTLSKAGTGLSRPFINAGSFSSGSSSTFVYTGNGDTTIENVAYNNLNFTPTLAASGKSYTFGTGALAIGGNLNINPAGDALVLSVILGGNTTVTGSVTVQKTGSATSSLSTNGANYSLSAGSINVDTGGTLTANDSTISLTGSGTPFTVTGTFSVGGSTVVYESTSATNIAGTTYNHLSLTPVGTPVYTLGTAGSQTINVNNLTIGNGTNGVQVNHATWDPAINITGNLTIAASAGTFTKSDAAAVITLKPAGTKIFTDNTAQDLGVVVLGSGTSTPRINMATDMKVTSLNINSSHQLDVNGTRTITLTGSGAAGSRPFINSGTFTPSTGTVAFTGTSASEIESTTYNHLSLTPAGTPIYTLGTAGSQTINVNDLTIGNGSNGVQVNHATYDPAINIAGNLLIAASAGTFTKSDAGTPAVITLKPTGTKTWTDNTILDIGVVVIGSGSSTPEITLASSVKATTVTIDASHELDFNGTRTMTLTGNGTVFTPTGTFAPSTGTVEFASAGTTGTDIPTTTYYNLTLNKASNTFTPASGSLNISNNLNITAGTLDLNTSDPTTAVTGNVTNDGVLSASSANPITISGNFTNNGTFTHNSGTVVFTPSSSSSTINGSSATTNFYSFTASSQANKTIIFKAGNTYGVSGVLTLSGSSAQPLDLRSDSNGVQWLITFTGTASIQNLKVKDAGCSSSNSIPVSESVLNNGNNGTCWIIIIRGGVGSGEGSSGGGSGQTGGGQGGGSGESGGGGGQSGGGSGGSGGGEAP